MKFEFGIDDRTVATLDKLIHTLQQMLKPECRYFGEDGPPVAAECTPPPAAPPAAAPKAPAPKPAKPAPSPPPAAPAVETPPPAAKPEPAPSQSLDAIFGESAPPAPRIVSDDELRTAVQGSKLDRGLMLQLLQIKYFSKTVREIAPESRFEFVADMAKDDATVIAELGAA